MAYIFAADSMGLSSFIFARDSIYAKRAYAIAIPSVSFQFAEFQFAEFQLLG